MKSTNLKELIEQYDVAKGGYIHFIGNTNKVEQEAMQKLVDNFLGELVTIDCRKLPFVENQGGDFPNAIRTYGTLEKKGNQYRVVADHHHGGSYAYFEIENVIELGSYGNGKAFKNDVKAVIGIRF